MTSRADLSHILEGGEKFRERGMRFEFARLEDADRIFRFMDEHFLPDEPLAR